MTVERDPLIDAIREAGVVPPPPARDDAFARAMAATGEMRRRRRVRRGVIALFAAAMLGAPAGVFAAHTFHDSPAVVPGIQVEKPDPGSSIAREVSDQGNVEPRQTEKAEDRSGTQTESELSASHENSSTSDDGATTSGGDDSSGTGSAEPTLEGDDEPAPTVTATASEEPDGSDGSSLSGGDSLSTDGGTEGP